MKVLSVNVGQPRENPWKTIKLTGIDKQPVAGPIGPSTPTPGSTWTSGRTPWTGSSWTWRAGGPREPQGVG